MNHLNGGIDIQPKQRNGSRNLTAMKKPTQLPTVRLLEGNTRLHGKEGTVDVLAMKSQAFHYQSQGH